MTGHSKNWLKHTVIGTVADCSCCSNALMMALIESLNTSVASGLDVVGQRRQTGTIEVLPGQLQLPKFDVISRIVVVATSNPNVRWFLITLDHKFC